MDKQKFYITTAIAYASRKPHIGNAYDIVLADMIARYKKMMGFDVYLMTGSDEHGQKIEEYAKADGISPKEFVDNAPLILRQFGTLLILAMTSLFVQLTITTKMLFKRFLKSFMTKAIFTKARTKVNTVCLVNRFTPKASL